MGPGAKPTENVKNLQKKIVFTHVNTDNQRSIMAGGKPKIWGWAIASDKTLKTLKYFKNYQKYIHCFGYEFMTKLVRRLSNVCNLCMLIVFALKSLRILFIVGYSKDYNKFGAS